MKKIVFANEKFSDRSHTLIASLNMDGDLVFDDEEVYSTGGREVDDTLVVHAEHKSHELILSAQAFNGISDTCSEAADERLFCTLERLAHSGHWKAMDEIESWLIDRDVPFTKQKLFIK